MKCPNCNEVLVMSERQGIEIDYCPKCRGVWLDKGELDKIIDRSSDDAGSKRSETDYYNKDEYKPGHDDSRRDQKYPPKKRRGFLGDLFEFD